MKFSNLVILAFLLACSTANAQFFKKVSKAVGQKMGNTVEDRLVDELSSAIVRSAVKPIDAAFDSMFRKSYKDQYGKPYDDSMHDGDPEKQAAMMNSILGSMYGTVELPESYKFGYKVHIKLHDYGEKKPHEMIMLVDSNGNIFGMVQSGQGKDQIMVFDIVEDQVVIFNITDSTAMAVPNVMGMASAFGKQALDQEKSKMKKFEKIKKTKKVINYQCQGYKYESEDEKGEFFVSDDLPFDWTDSFGGLVEKISPNFYKDNPEYKISGMLMYAKSKRKSDNKESKWEVTKIDDSGLFINCSDYKLANMMGATE